MRAVLDANVLFPTILREILTDLAATGLYAPIWSARILDEWRHAAARLGPDQAAVAGAEIALLSDRLPDALTATTAQAAADLPDTGDQHVLDTALSGRANLIVTANLRDFPRPIMARFDLRAIHPDAFLLELHARAPHSVVAAVQAARDKAARMGGDMTVPDMLKRSRLPRLAKAVKG
ncbi:RSP_2648 family PIN domain-containing protein [Paracoccus sp. (in: a-proteobacteria)]|uniref:RSP_2648 family PIN domain-containing protein n=1 Tax=Paracoccus sp. TaxID=267 RepID=UPI0026DF9873|nr:PIN domain-containing protein [Paracoccus sp. (in: a-proteobacteria)]MDO5648516.1 PIN domain-containing protein [Paracoccus sp. (in: a-proteobacteria)]